LKAEEEVYFQHLMKKEILIQKKYATAEKAETEKYLKLKEQYVCHIYIKNFRNYCLYLSYGCNKIIVEHYRIKRC